MSKRSLTPRRMPSPGASTSVIQALVKGVPDERDDDRSREEDDDEAEEQKPQPRVPAGELGLHQSRIGSSAMATKSRAR